VLIISSIDWDIKQSPVAIDLTECVKGADLTAPAPSCPGWTALLEFWLERVSFE